MIINNPKNRTQTIFSGKGGIHDEASEGREELASELEEGLSAASEEIIKAIADRNAGGLKEALRAFFEMCDELPHEEGPHI